MLSEEVKRGTITTSCSLTVQKLGRLNDSQDHTPTDGREASASYVYVRSSRSICAEVFGSFIRDVLHGRAGVEASRPCQSRRLLSFKFLWFEEFSSTLLLNPFRGSEFSTTTAVYDN